LKIKVPFSRFIVKDHSMEPAFCEFDRVFIVNFGNIKKGSVIVFKSGENYFIKRVKELKSDGVVAVSDNKAMAKKVYEVKRVDIVGRVFLKY